MLSAREELGLESRQSLVRVKAWGLVVPRRESAHYYKYDLMDLGATVLETLKEEKT